VKNLLQNPLYVPVGKTKKSHFTEISMKNEKSYQKGPKVDSREKRREKEREREKRRVNK